MKNLIIGCGVAALLVLTGYFVGRGTAPAGSGSDHGQTPELRPVEVAKGKPSRAQATPPRPADRVEVTPEHSVGATDVAVAELSQDPLFKDFDAELAEEVYDMPWEGKEWVIPRADPMVWEAKYGHMTLEELNRARADVDLDFALTTNELFADRRARGLISINPMQYRTNPDGSKTKIPMSIRLKGGNGRGGVPMKRTVSRLDENGQHIVELMWLPPDEYPEYYALVDEKTWLHNTINDVMGEALQSK